MSNATTGIAMSKASIFVEGILTQFRAKEVDWEWSLAEYKAVDTGKWTHSYHRYPAKFIPQLVEKLIDEYIEPEKEVHINDPFMGCGTTIVTAISRGFAASGTDINRIAYLITKVKSTPILPSHLEKKIDQITTNLDLVQRKWLVVQPFVPERHLERINFWFQEENIENLGKILRLIYNEEDPTIRDFFLVAFSHILKNCSIWLQRSTKPTRDRQKSAANPFVAFCRHLRKMQRGNAEFYKIVPDHVKKNIDLYLKIGIGDARKQPDQDDSVDMVITSSPYVTSYEYADLHQLSTIWLDLVDDLTEYRKVFIGSSSKMYEDRTVRSTIAMDIVTKMEKIDRKVAKEIEAFFIDMEDVFQESFRILKPGGRCCYVIGNTRLKGVDILNAEVFSESLQLIGFKLDRIIKRQIPSKILPQKRDERTGRFSTTECATMEAYPVEYIVIGLKEGRRT